MVESANLFQLNVLKIVTSRLISAFNGSTGCCSRGVSAGEDSETVDTTDLPAWKKAICGTRRVVCSGSSAVICLHVCDIESRVTFFRVS